DAQETLGRRVAALRRGLRPKGRLRGIFRRPLSVEVEESEVRFGLQETAFSQGLRELKSRDLVAFGARDDQLPRFVLDGPARVAARDGDVARIGAVRVR